ncbi:MAG TPA: YIP1 family protein [Anaerolineales bacterium]|nr:YIP1 family protein [Anaerolineales bacterium]
MGKFSSYYFPTLLRPRRTFDALMQEPHRLRYGFFALLISAVIYTFVYIFLTMGGGAPSTLTPILNIPEPVYYSYDRFILLPSMFAAALLSAAVAHLLSKLASGSGSFDDTLSAFGFAIGLPSLFSLLHDLPDSFLGAVGLLDLRWYEVALNSPTIWRVILWTLYGLSFLFFFILFPKAVGASQRIKPLPAILIGFLSYFIYQGFFLVFNR